MEPDILGKFYRDKHTREAVEEFFSIAMDKKTLELAYSGEDTRPVKQAKEYIDHVFYMLQAKYDKKEKKDEELSSSE